MNKLIISLTIVLLFSIVGVAATNCFTIINTPQNEKYYWKAITYDHITDDTLTLESTSSITVAPMLGLGIQFNIQINQDCFGHFLPIHEETTGITSNTLLIQQQSPDYKTALDPTGQQYTISEQLIPIEPPILISNIPSCNIDQKNYCQIPNILTTVSPAYQTFKYGLCNNAFTIKEQIDAIRYKIWQNFPSAEIINCVGYINRIECIILQKKDTDPDYALLTALLARECGIPTRIAYGISQGTYNGIDLTFPDNKHYWIEYYNQGHWYTAETNPPKGPTDKETNCQNNIDDDLDGAADCHDTDCTGELACEGTFPTTTQYINQYSTILSDLPNAYNIETISLGDYYGSVTWKGHLDLRNQNLDNTLFIQKNQLTINNQIPALNIPNTIIMRDISYDAPTIQRNGLPCTECNITTLSILQHSITFTTPGIGTYTLIGPNNQSNITLPPPSGTIITTPTSAGFNYKKVWNTITKIWNSIPLSNLIKIIIILAIILLIIWWRRRQKRKRFQGWHP